MYRAFMFAALASFLIGFPSHSWAQAQWLASDQNLTNQSASQLNRETDAGRSIVIDSQNNIYVSWMDFKTGNWDIYFRWYDEDGWRQEGNVSANASTSRNPTLMVRPKVPGVDPEQIWVAWVDNSSGQYEAYYRRWNAEEKSWIDNAPLQLSDAGGAPIVYNSTTKSGVNLCTTTDGSKVYAFYPNDLSPYNKAYTKTFQNNTWTTEAQVPTRPNLR